MLKTSYEVITKLLLKLIEANILSLSEFSDYISLYLYFLYFAVY